MRAALDSTRVEAQIGSSYRKQSAHHDADPLQQVALKAITGKPSVRRRTL
jgi:hypothetical protein